MSCHGNTVVVFCYGSEEDTDEAWAKWENEMWEWTYQEEE